MSINKTLFRQQLDELKRAGNERRFNELQSKYQSPEAIDYSNMSLRDELQTRFDLDELNRLSAELGKDINSVANTNNNEEYGKKTAQELDKYVENYKIPDWPNYFGPAAPVIDFARNYSEMLRKNLDPSDKFFHCKANYEAASRGKNGEDIATTLGRLRETIDMLTGDGATDSLKDLRANARGRIGYKTGKTLKESCPTFYKDYEKWY